MDGWLIFDPPNRGDWNMSVDETLMSWAAETGQAILRFYEWSEPTLSLGYFQSAVDRSRHPTSLPCSWVRRSTGGGAILHDRELTYSIALPTADRSRREARWLYDVMHETLIELLRSLGVAAQLCDFERHWPRGEEPFLCFQRRTIGDVLLAGNKVGGSAQRRQPGVALQHGSVLLQRSRAAPELLGIGDLSEASLEVIDVARRWSDLSARRLSLRLEEVAALPTVVRERAETVLRDKFGAASWNEKR